jgi:hypothetical protein
VNFILAKPYNNNKIKIAFTRCNAQAFFLISTIIKIEDVFAGTLVRYPYLSRFLSSFAFVNKDMCLSQLLSLFTFGDTKESYKKSLLKKLHIANLR